MRGASTRLAAAVEAYFADLGRIHASGGATGERSSYGPLANLLNAVGATLKPKVFCVGELANQGAGHPDFGLYTARQVQRGRPREGQTPERGVVEVKAAGGGGFREGSVSSGDGASAAGSIGRRTRSCSTRSAPTTGRTCSRGTCGSKHASGKPGKISHAEPWSDTMRTISATGCRASSRSGFAKGRSGAMTTTSITRKRGRPLPPRTASEMTTTVRGGAVPTGRAPPDATWNTSA